MFMFPRFSRAATRSFPLVLGGAIGGGAFYTLSPRLNSLRIRNDAVAPSRPQPGESIAQYAAPVHGKGLSRFGGKLDYHQLTFGSFAGMISGYFFGRISKMLVGVIVTSLMATEYLAASGHIDLRPFYRSVYQWCLRHWDQEVLVEDPSFKYSFGLAFLIAAYNA